MSKAYPISHRFLQKQCASLFFIKRQSSSTTPTFFRGKFGLPVAGFFASDTETVFCSVLLLACRLHFEGTLELSFSG